MTKRDAKLLDEARGAIKRLEATLYTGDNRFGTYGDNCRASIKRWEETIARITGGK